MTTENCGGWFRVLNAEWDEYARALRPSTFMVYLGLRRRAKGGTCFPGIDRMADDLGIGEHTVRRSIADLRAARMIAVEEHRAAGGVWLQNVYRLLPREEWLSPQAILACGFEPQAKSVRSHRPKVRTNNTKKENKIKGEAEKPQDTPLRPSKTRPAKSAELNRIAEESWLAVLGYCQQNTEAQQAEFVKTHPVPSPEALEKAVTALGGWGVIKNAPKENIKWARRDFHDAFRNVWVEPQTGTPELTQ